MKLRSRIFALTAALAATTCAGVRAMGTANPSDVSILGCRAERSLVPSTDGTGVVQGGSGFRILFENQGAAELSEVTFAVEEDGHSIVREDVGRFSPRARIDHYFAAGDLPQDSPPVCTVVKVRGG
jgi:hypothetical protein